MPSTGSPRLVVSRTNSALELIIGAQCARSPLDPAAEPAPGAGVKA